MPVELSELLESFTPDSLYNEVLAFLDKNATKGYTATELAKFLKKPKTSVCQSLAQLTKMDKVKQKSYKNNVYYYFNKK